MDYKIVWTDPAIESLGAIITEKWRLKIPLLRSY